MPFPSSISVRWPTAERDSLSVVDIIIGVIFDVILDVIFGDNFGVNSGSEERFDETGSLGGSGSDAGPGARIAIKAYVPIMLRFICFLGTNMIITLVFEKNANFFAENGQKSQKIVIITSTPASYNKNLRNGTK
jgi:hypothetical protein